MAVPPSWEIDPRLFSDPRYASLSPQARILWYHLLRSSPHHGLSVEEVSAALQELADADLLAHLQRYAAPAEKVRN
ncbi:MAG: hypothetical protein QN173_04190 [Armatimonadota bacterium]|nr:hypothetical protein [Armatimonadota bacterium]MDR7402218.1 hypothetical protein [Armatimonadota bacterium]MDR7403346.1 hypothetical protein [Armatimonadota bacterium]MDR7436974.1 hypothetical protein [Armatimonadota bacterium]MDR7472252.1 hypothetical protein [Armatimonadota bacterium]